MRLLHNDSLYMKLNLLVSLLMVQFLNDIFCMILFSGCSLGIGVGILCLLCRRLTFSSL